MKLDANLTGENYAVDFRREGSHIVAKIDDRQYELVRQSSAQEFLLIHDGKVFDCRVAGRPESGKTIDVMVGTKRYQITLTDPKRLRGATGAGAHTVEAAHIVAPMPGKIVRVLVEVGAQVEAGEGIVVVEAMKMQNEMKSPKAGVVISLNVREGATVSGGDVLAVIE